MPLTGGDVHACGYVFTEGDPKPAHCPSCGFPSDGSAGPRLSSEELIAESEAANEGTTADEDEDDGATTPSY